MTETYKIIDEMNNESLGFLSDFVKGGFKEFLAKLLIYMGSEKTQETLCELPADFAAELSQKLSDLKDAKPNDKNISAAASSVLENYFCGTYKVSLANLKSESYKNPNIKNEFQSLAKTNPLLFKKLQDDIFCLEDVVFLDDRAVQKILQKTEKRDIAVAIKNLDSEIQDKFFRNLSKNAEKMLKDEIDFAGEVSKDDEIAAQKKILDSIFALADAGEILLPKDFDFFSER